MIDWTALERQNEHLGAFVDLDHDAVSGLGPLAGVSIGIKANIAVRGLPWTGGMATRRDIVASRDAEVVTRLRGAGALIPGTLNMHEAALGATTDNPWYGRTLNPHGDGHTAGGSSGGSGAAVAAGLCDAALGTDTLGSVRIPAAYTGVYGLKPTLGAVPDAGLVPLAAQFDVIGPLARSLDVLDMVWRVIADAAGADLPLTRLIVLDGLGRVEIEPAVAAAYDRALAAIQLPRRTFALPAPAGAIRHAAFVAAARALIGHLGADRTARAADLSPELTGYLEYAGERTVRQALIDEAVAAVREAVGSDGVLLLPTAPQAAFRHGTPAPANQADFTTLASIAGLPALSLPAGRDDHGLPVAVQFVGPPSSEPALIALAGRLSDELGGCQPPPM